MRKVLLLPIAYSCITRISICSCSGDIMRTEYITSSQSCVMNLPWQRKSPLYSWTCNRHSLLHTIRLRSQYPIHRGRSFGGWRAQRDRTSHWFPPGLGCVRCRTQLCLPSIDSSATIACVRSCVQGTSRMYGYGYSGYIPEASHDISLPMSTGVHVETVLLWHTHGPWDCSGNSLTMLQNYTYHGKRRCLLQSRTSGTSKSDGLSCDKSEH